MNVDYILYKNGLLARFEVDIPRRLEAAGVMPQIDCCAMILCETEPGLFLQNLPLSDCQGEGMMPSGGYFN